MRTAYTSLTKIWDYWMTFAGHKRALYHYIARIPLDLPHKPQVLDVGCGTGIVSFGFLERYPYASILAIDIDAAMLSETKRIAEKKKISAKNIILSEGDINALGKLKDYQTGRSLLLKKNSYDVIITSGSLEHADREKALPLLVSFLKP